MKNLYSINKFSIIATILLYFTFWGGIMAQMVLGAVQIIMNLIIIAQFNKLSKSLKYWFIAYVLITLVVIGLFRRIGQNGNDGLVIMFGWILVSMLLAIFHLYITYKINRS